MELISIVLMIFGQYVFYYGGDDRWDLEANIGRSGGKPGWLNDWVDTVQGGLNDNSSATSSAQNKDVQYTKVGKNSNVFLSSDSKCLDSIEGEAGELHPLSTFGWNMYGHDHKHTRQNFDKSSGRRSDLNKTISRKNPNSLLPSIPLHRKVLCIDHSIARTVGKLVELSFILKSDKTNVEGEQVS